MLEGLNAPFIFIVFLVHENFMFLKMAMTAVLYLDYILSKQKYTNRRRGGIRVQ